MNKFKFKIKYDGSNYYYLINNKLLISQEGNKIKIENKIIAHNLYREIKKFSNLKDLYNSNILKILFFSFDANHKIIKKYLFKYIDADTVCYRDSKKSELEIKQQKLWSPLIKNIELRYKIKLNIQYGIMPLKQNLDTKKKLVKVMNKLSKFSLCNFYFITKITNSVIISLNLLEYNIKIKEALTMSRLEEEYNRFKWGKIDEEINILQKDQLFLKAIIKLEKIFRS